MGRPDVGRMMRQMTGKQFELWKTFATVEPLPDVRADIYAAMICCTLANVHRNSKKKPEPFKVTDFLIDWDKQGGQKKKDWRSMKMQAMKWFALATAAEDKRKRK